MTTHDRAARPPRPKTTREMLAQIVEKLDRVLGKENQIMALTQAELDAFTDLVAAIDAKFNEAQAPLIAELRAQIDALAAEDAVDQAEVDRLTAIVTTAEADTLAAIQGVKDHVAGLAAPA